jgi:hypothetical protein
MLNKKLIPSVLWLSLLLSILSGCGAGSVDVQTTGTGETQARLLSISITPLDSAIAQNTVHPFTATGIYSDNTTQDLTGSVTWSSSDTNISTIADTAALASDMTTQNPMAAPSTSGRHAYAYGRNAGKTTITATSGDISDSTTLTVTNATLISMAITPTNPVIANGTAQQFIVTGTFSDNTTQDLTAGVTWSSSNTGVAAISNATGSKGSATSIAAGTTVITAISGGVSGTATLTVTAVTITGSATLAWNAPTTYTDGSPLTGLAGYKIYYGPSQGIYTSVIDAGNTTTYTMTNLSPGACYFAVTSYDISGVESAYSNEASKIIQ